MEERERRQIQLPSGATVGIAEYGDPDGRPLAFYHGWPSSRRQAQMLHEPAKKRGVRVIAIDRPGISLSSFQEDRRLLDWPPLMREIADALSVERFSILAVSGGAPYALAAGYGIPDRLERVGIVCGAPPLSMFKEKGDLHVAYRFLHTVRIYTPWIMAPFLPIVRHCATLSRDNPLVRAAMIGIPKVDRDAMADDEGFKSVADSLYDAAGSPMKAIITDGDIYFADWGFDLGDVSAPVHFWHGELDSNIPCRMVREIVRQIPNATGRWYPDEGHYSLPLCYLDEILDELLV